MAILTFLLDRLSDEFFGDIFQKAKSKVISSIKRKTINKYEIVDDNIQESVRLHLTSVAKIADYFHLKGMNRPKSVSDVYINLNIRLSAKKWDYKKRATRKFYDIVNLLSSEKNHLIILGDPGAGKSTTIKRICSLLIFENIHSLGHLRFPILIRLRELKENESLFDRLKSILAISIVLKEKSKDGEATEKNTLLKSFIIEYLDLLGIMLLIDGLDEVSEKKANVILDEVQELTTCLINSKLLLTSRSGSFERSIECTSIYELEPLNIDQTDDFINKWFKSTSKAKKFKTQLISSPHFSKTLKPLDLTLLSSLFENYGYIPEQPKDVYRKRIKLYIEEWDKENNVKRNSKYSQLDVDGKFYFLTHLAFWLSFNNTRRLYNEQDLMVAYSKINEYFNLPKSEVKQVIKELETHTGLIISSTYEGIEFYHKTIQEYFTAYYLHEMPSIPLAKNLPDEFSIATSLCPDPNAYFINLLLKYTSEKYLTGNFFQRYLYRLNIENIRFQFNILHIIVLFLSYEVIFINNELGYHVNEAIELRETRKGKPTTTNYIKAFLKKYANRTAIRSFLSSYSIKETDSKTIYMLEPKLKFILSTTTDLYKEFHNLFHKKIYVTKELLDYLRNTENSKKENT